MVTKISEQNISNSYISLHSDTEITKLQNPSFPLQFLQSLKEKSSTNPIKTVWNWFINCLKNFWEFIYKLMGIPTHDEIGTLELKKDVFLTKVRIIILRILLQIDNEILKSQPCCFEKIILYFRFGNSTFKEVFTDKSKISSKVENWLKVRNFSDTLNIIAYVFHEQKTGWFQSVPFMNIFRQNFSVRDNKIPLMETFNLGDLPFSFNDIKRKNNKYILEEVLPQLNRKFCID